MHLKASLTGNLAEILEKELKNAEVAVTRGIEDKNIVILTQNKYPCHVGIYAEIDGGGVLHNMQGVGVVFQKLPELKMNGWQIMEILEYAANS